MHLVISYQCFLPKYFSRLLKEFEYCFFTSGGNEMGWWGGKWFNGGGTSTKKKADLKRVQKEKESAVVG